MGIQLQKLHIWPQSDFDTTMEVTFLYKIWFHLWYQYLNAIKCMSPFSKKSKSVARWIETNKGGKLRPQFNGQLCPILGASRRRWTRPKQSGAVYVPFLIRSSLHPYLIFVIFLHRQKFWTENFTPKNALITTNGFCDKIV